MFMQQLETMYIGYSYDICVLEVIKMGNVLIHWGVCLKQEADPSFCRCQ